MKNRILLILAFLLFAGLSVFGQTELKGTISSDSTLTLSKSPYLLTGSVTIKSNAILTIESGCVINMGSYNILAGSTSAGKLVASHVTFKTTNSTEKYINFRDGSTGTLSNCNFEKVFIRVEDGAGSPLTFTGNNFINTLIPIKISPNTSPVISGNTGTNQIIGLQGTVKQNKTLPKYEWDYELSGVVYIQNNSTLTIAPEIKIDFWDNQLIIGNSTNGVLIADNVTFITSYQYGSKIILKDGGNGSFTNCVFSNIYISLESDAGPYTIVKNNSFTNIKFPVELDVNSKADISGNTSTVEKISLKGTVVNDILLKKYDWDFLLGNNVYVTKNKTLTVGNGILIDLYRFHISSGNSTSGNLQLSNSTLKSTHTGGGYINFKDGGIGSVSNCTFNNVYLSVEDDAGESISFSENQFSNIEIPIKISANHSPTISGNTAESENIGLFGNVIRNNTLPKYQWNYKLVQPVIIKNNSVLTLADSVRIDLNMSYVSIGGGSSSPGTLNATNVIFKGAPDNRGKLNFNGNSGGTLNHCSFDQTYIKIDNCSPSIQNSRFYHSKTALEIKNAANPTLNFNDFYNNEKAILHSGSLLLNASNNFWGHFSGPQHTTNITGLGELIEGNINFSPYKTTPNTGTINVVFSPAAFQLGIISTGNRIDTSFTIKNKGDIDILITEIENHNSTTSVRSYDRFWLFPDSSLIVRFSVTPIEDGIFRDTIFLSTNNNNNPKQQITISAVGNIDSMNIKFNKIVIDSFPLVKCYFTVTDQADIPLSEIVKSNITLKEDGNTITDFDFITKMDISAPVAAVLVIDRSNSMMGQPLRDAKYAAIDFVNELAPNDMAAVIDFNENIHIAEPFTSDKTELIKSIGYINSIGGTAIFNAIARAIDSLQNKPGNKAIIALTDGQDNRSNVTPDAIIAMALQYGISIYTIGLSEDAESSTIDYISSATGGQYYYAPTSEVLSIIYRRISGQLQNQYLVQYTAPENNPFPRIIELTVNYLDLMITDSIRYTNQKQTISFQTGTEPFKLGEFAKNSTSYFYYKINDNQNNFRKGESISFVNKSGTSYILYGGQYLGEGIFQFWVDLPKDLNKTHLLISIPDSIIHNGSYINFENKPPAFDVPLLNYAVNQNVDVFVGGSLGSSGIVGGVGAGPSVSALKISAKGTVGMGLNFERDANGNEYISRRFEAGTGGSVECPSINTVAGNVEAGGEAGYMIKPILGQTMRFQSDISNDNDAIKAKTLYLLETFSLGAFSLSPDCSLLKQAIKRSLSLLDNGIISAYNEHYYSSLYGLNIEGNLSVGISIGIGESDENSFKLADAGIDMVYSGEFIDYPQTNDKSINFGYAVSMGFSLGNLSVSGVDLGPLAGYTGGADFNLGANFNLSKGFHSFDISMGLSETDQILFGQKYNKRTLAFNVPKKVITRALDSQNLISTVAPFFDSGAPKMDFQIGKDYFLNSISSMFNYSSGPLDNVDDHIVIKTSKIEAECFEIDASVEIDAALVLGLGLELGVNLAYVNEKSSPDQENTIVDGKLLPLAFHKPPGKINLVSLKSEIEFLLEHAPLLVKEMINTIVEEVTEAINAGKDFIVESLDEGCTFLGNIGSDAGETFESGLVKLTSYIPYVKSANLLKSSLLEPEIMEAYFSRKVSSHSDQIQRVGNNNQNTLVLISNCYRVNVYNQNNSILPEFNPGLLKIAINLNQFNKLGFDEGDKQQAAIFYYDFASLTWIEMPDDLHEHPDTVTTEINKSGTYAVGILYQPQSDITAPEILNYYPTEGGVFDPDSVFRAELFEPILGSGINITGSSLEIDGKEVETFWNPVQNMLYFNPKEPLDLGVHNFKITATDFNKNQVIKVIVFTVNKISTHLNETVIKNFSLSCYPNPVNDFLTIKLENGIMQAKYQVDIINSAGQFINRVFDGTMESNSEEIRWNLKDYQNNRILSGMYFVRVKTPDSILVKKITVN